VVTTGSEADNSAMVTFAGCTVVVLVTVIRTVLRFEAAVRATAESAGVIMVVRLMGT
jgi:hypothetical protein